MIDPEKSTSAMRITFVAGDLSDGGGLNRVVNHLSSMFAKQLRARVKVVGIGASGEPTYPFPADVEVRSMGWLTALKALLRDKPDYAIASWTQLNFVIILALLFSRTRVIACEHTSWFFQPPSIRFLRRLIYPLAWRVIVLNPCELVHYSRYLRNVRLIANPVPAAAAARDRDREKLIIAIGHLQRRKNFIDAIKAMELSRLEASGWSLVIFGAGEREQILSETIRNAGLTRTRLHPPTADLESWYNRASVTLVTAKLEVFSMVLAEAMAAGVVPIAYATDGPSFLLKDFPDHLIEIGDVEGLADRMREFAANEISPALRARLSASIENRFSPAVVMHEWRTLLDEDARTRPQLSSLARRRHQATPR